MTPSLGDLAERTAQQMVAEMTAPVEEAASVMEEADLSKANSLFSKITFSWRAEDRKALDRIRIAADSMFAEAFSDTINVIDDFYRCLWTPELDGNGQVRRGADGHVIWKTGTNGKPIEDWSQLNGQDIEQALLNLQRARMLVAPEVNKLFLEAVYARNAASDSYDDTWGSMMDGTQGDKTARSNTNSRVDRYHAYFRFYLWSVAKTFLDEINQFQRTLSNIRAWQVGNRYA